MFSISWLDKGSLSSSKESNKMMVPEVGADFNDLDNLVPDSTAPGNPAGDSFPDGSRWMTRKQVARYLNVHPNTVDNWSKRGMKWLNPLKVGRTVRFDRSEIDANLSRLRKYQQVPFVRSHQVTKESSNILSRNNDSLVDPNLKKGTRS
ncbi:MAG: helix-turn-helix domain-containing protein [Lewinellaceae bacterium]|nr:helix-turn-helix domain-containing protein [Saprospiraceae bacterium]MCB9311187.1 helix-turn-helix domain-containing protein [Lewinellaceae bacterium]